MDEDGGGGVVESVVGIILSIAYKSTRFRELACESSQVDLGRSRGRGQNRQNSDRRIDVFVLYRTVSQHHAPSQSRTFSAIM
jgi:hypothetical protein